MASSFVVARQTLLSASTLQPAAFAVEDHVFPPQICGAIIQTPSNPDCWSSAKLSTLPEPKMAPSIIMVDISGYFMAI